MGAGKVDVMREVPGFAMGSWLSCVLHNIHYAKLMMGRLRWVWLWITSCLLFTAKKLRALRAEMLSNRRRCFRTVMYRRRHLRCAMNYFAFAFLGTGSLRLPRKAASIVAGILVNCSSRTWDLECCRSISVAASVAALTHQIILLHLLEHFSQRGRCRIARHVIGGVHISDGEKCHLLRVRPS